MSIPSSSITLFNFSKLFSSISIFSAAVNAKVKRIIFCSSMARYGDQETPFNEKMKPKCVN